ncbi:DUF4124 domain-containing protein [Methylonatrum kenyense]|uniref:DUF4124 domain-containing protein n=1 Tax=Methylonatrum kenyense TaxID=455253 RepID=UPI0020C022F2|nr:DUF4124 domain-containing protein [Methylonatrum kenyense]MCK8515269.1 DUF4124 domain-containing protein [Methylonatrum kenyense]
MRILLSILALSLAVTLSTGATIYRYVDQDGNVSFSDQPSEGAERIEIEGSSTYTSPPRSPRRERPEQPIEEEAAPGYELVQILSPADQGTVRDNEGRVTVRAETRPPLRDGHTLALLLNGDAHGEPQRGYSFELTDIHRGEHTVQLVVVDADGQAVAESTPHVFYMHQASQLFPQRQGPAGTGITPGPAQ